MPKVYRIYARRPISHQGRLVAAGEWIEVSALNAAILTTKSGRTWSLEAPRHPPSPAILASSPPPPDLSADDVPDEKPPSRRRYRRRDLQADD